MCVRTLTDCAMCRDLHMLKQVRIEHINHDIEHHRAPRRSRADALLLNLGGQPFAHVDNGDKLTAVGAACLQQHT